MSLFSAIGDVVSGVAEAVLGSDGVLGTLADAVGLGDVYDGLGLDTLIDGSVGGFMNSFFDGLGFPDIVGDLFGAAIDLGCGNPLGVAENLIDAADDVLDAVGVDLPIAQLDGETFLDIIS